MRRSTRLLLVLLGVLLVVVGGYTGYWFIVAGRIADGVTTWAQSERADKIDVSWRKLAMTGFPTSFRVELEAVTVRDDALTPSPEFRIPAVSGTARPWDFADWRLAARKGFNADIAGSGDRVPAKLSAQTADGVVSIEQGGGWKLWLRAQNASLEAASPVLVNSADAWVIAPPRPPDRHVEPQLTLAVNARQVTLPVGIAPLGNAIEELDFGAKIKGAIPNGRLPEALAAWRDAGGTIELDNLGLKWGPIDATASGTIAFDQELQPVVAFSGGIEGYDQLLTALVERGQMRASDANLARIALTMLAKAGPDGKPEIRTAFSIRNGQFFLGPARLGKAPHLTWE
jgi:hypothetical protein